jgi:hypothetical protein
VIPAIVRVTVVFLPIAHVPPLFASVIVTVVPEVDPLAEQFVAPPVRDTVGVAGIVNEELKPTVIVAPAASAPPGFPLLVLNPTVQVERAPALCGEPLKLTFETDGSIT